ncbi:ABC transporter ATP-binding protein [Peptostreptococcus sp. D1]|uniref:ABC transporter ATP-binding protein n=1 Tax=Peptostreptococcus sp. D1 TaxID=72304 RepID=UPI0008DF5C46|nr:ABC transporter ATP-binding protein [Peptostreptococcus sp. D1]SFE22647.1 iron complex transport system ATP-binding protein [Peptostreptococcus sp. D1]
MKLNKVKIDNLTFSIDSKVICDGITINFKRDSFAGIIGPNGSGKSTLLKQIYRVIEPIQGKIYIDDFDIKNFDSKKLAKIMAVLPQENQSDFDYTVGDIVLMGRFPYHSIFDSSCPHEEDNLIMREYLDLVGLKDREHRFFKTLSGGEKQRVLLARALAQKSNLIVLDEVTNHLDIGYQYKVLEILRKLGLTIIAAIHDLNLAMRFCDEIILIDEGKVIDIGEPRAVITEKVLRDVFRVNARIVEDEDTTVINYISSYY